MLGKETTHHSLSSATAEVTWLPQPFSLLHLGQRHFLCGGLTRGVRPWEQKSECCSCAVFHGRLSHARPRRCDPAWGTVSPFVELPFPPTKSTTCSRMSPIVKVGHMYACC